MNHHVAKYRQQHGHGRHRRQPLGNGLSTLLAVGITGGVIAVIAVVANVDDKEAKKRSGFIEGEERAAGYELAKQLISPALLSPSTAKWPWDSVYSVSVHVGPKYRVWDVHGDVDSPNTFNVPVRHHWTLTLRYDPSTQKFRTLKAVFSGEVLMGSDDELRRIEETDRWPEKKTIP